ncbi:MAG: DUF2271 domain-containing protein [Chitinispirillaceae bacterium]|nr:DUF2271 domain-containing protein [Chitinispirillaceae bacterium]
MKLVLSKKYSLIITCVFMLFGASIFASDAEKVVTITAKTATYGGEWAEKSGNYSMIWIQKPDSTYIKTIYCGFLTLKHASYFDNWLKNTKGTKPPDKLSDLEVDGVSSATRTSHDKVITVNWNLTDRENKPVPEGDYQFWIQMTENDDAGFATFGTITIDGTSKIAKGTTTDVFPELKACIGDLCASKVIVRNNNGHSVSIARSGNIFKINLPSSSPYSASLISPSGKIITDNRGNGKTTTLNLNNNRLKSGVYLIKVVQSGKVYTQKNIFGF